MRRGAAALALLGLLRGQAAAAQQAMDPDNPTCPRELNWSTYRQMHFSLDTSSGHRILRAEGVIDEGAPDRLKAALDANKPIDEIWIRSPGGDARAGNAAGKIVRDAMIPTRIPKSWACFSACNFLFMGGVARFVDDGGLFIVHMFTHTGDREALRAEVSGGGDKAAATVGSIEQDSALLASEDNDFLIRMGVSRKLLTDVMYKQKAVAEQGGDRSTRRCLSQEETMRYNVANAR
ncbi:MAG TPA: hypothetical protein VFW19_09870 [Allosphingosinicella sp.]|nr:hypothetical protein [Allosphingosinicella sp.]